MSDLFEDVEKKIMYWIGTFTKKHYGVSTFAMKANSKINPPADYITYDFPSDREICQSYSQDYLSEDGESLINEQTSPMLLMISLNAYGDKAKQKILDLKSSLSGVLWNSYFSYNGLGFVKADKIRDLTVFNRTEYQQVAHTDIYFNFDWKVLEEIAYIDDFGGSGSINQISGSGNLGDITIEYDTTE